MKLSRHARNNMRLYRIEMQDILLTIGSPEQTDTEGNRLVAFKRHPNKFSGYPVKVVYAKIGRTSLSLRPIP